MVRGRLRRLFLLGVAALTGLTTVAAPARATDDGGFTIRAITPNLTDRTVRLDFTRDFDPQQAHERTRVIPPVGSFNVSWGGARNVLVLHGEFRHGTRYVVKFSEGFAASDGTAYTESRKEFLFPDKPAAIRFSGVGTEVERRSRQLVHFEVVNVASTLLETRRLSPAAALALGPPRRWEETTARAAGIAAALEAAVPAADPLRPFLAGAGTRRDLFDTKAPRNEEATYSIPLSQRDGGAILLARLRDNAAAGTAQTDPVVLDVTDLGITCLASSEGTLVWVTSLETGLPVAGVEIAGATGDGLLFHAGRTDADGLLEIPAGEKAGFRVSGRSDALQARPDKLAADRYRLRAVAAVTADDAAVQDVPDGLGTAVAVPGIRQSGSIADRSTPTNAGVFTERGAYRPGETVHVKATVRRFRDGTIEPPPGEPCRLSVTDARGRTVHTAEVALSEFGTAAIDVALASAAPLGEYRVDLRSGGATAFATFRVEEFVPPRHFARIGFEQRRRVDDTFVGRPVEMTFVAVTIEGSYYAGGPVKNGRVRWRLAFGPTAQRLPGWDDYVFGHDADEQEGETALESGEAFLDAAGRLTVEFPVSAEVLAGERSLVVSAAVVDFDGRAASTTASWTPEAERRIGIAAHPREVQAGEEQEVHAVLVDAEGRRVPDGLLTAEILRRSWVSYRKRNLAGNEYWVSERVWKRVRTAELRLADGQGSLAVSFDGWGEYLVRLRHEAPDGSVCSAATRYQVGWDSWGRNPGQEVGYTLIPLSSDRPRYRPGQTAILRAGARQRAAAWLFVIERRGVLSARVLRPQGDLPELGVPVTAESAPNVYAALVGTVPRGPFPVYSGRLDDGVPIFLHGVVNLPVVTRPAALAVTIAPGRAQELTAEPGAEVALDLAVADEDGRGVRAELAVAVVDEAVLALTGYRTPDLSGITRFDLPLGVLLSDSRRFLVAQTPFKAVRTEPFSGGGEGEGMPLETRRIFKPVAYWNPALVTDDAGRAAVRFTLPEQMTAFRVMVVACDVASAFGNAERRLRVTKPFYLEPGLPRFLTKGDRFRFDVAAFNQGGAPGVMDFSLEASGPVSLAAERRSYPVGAHDRAAIPVAGSASAVGTATVRVAGALGGLRDAVELSVPVRSGNVIGRKVWYGSVRGTAALAPELPADARAAAADPDLLAETTAVLTLSGSPFLRLTEGLRYLLHYPYGCVEQTSSGVIPLAALRTILARGGVPGIDAAEVEPYLAKGVERLLGMQTSSGGFGYWPGDREPSPWGTFYAASALLEARAAGVAVPDEAFDRLASYLRIDRLSRPPEEAGSAMALYLLARSGKARDTDFAAIRPQLDTLARQPRILALLAASYGGFLPPGELEAAASAAVAAPRDEGRYHYGFDTRHRGDAMALLLLDRVSPGDPAAAALAARLFEERDEQGRWGRTSDTGWVLLALGRHFAAEAEGEDPHRVTVRVGAGEGRTVELPARGSAEMTLPAAAFLAAPSVALASDPEREVLFAVTLAFPRVGYAAHGNEGGFRIGKRIENADGSAEIRVGDLVRVTLEIDPPQRGSRFVVVDDPLPAGLVAINAAFASEEGLPRDNDAVAARDRGDEDFWSFYWSDEGYYRFVPDRLELRDDRVVAFRNDLWGWRDTSFRFVYYARAVCEGEFALPSTKVERMYEPDVNGYTPRTTLRIGALVP